MSGENFPRSHMSRWKQQSMLRCCWSAWNSALCCAVAGHDVWIISFPASTYESIPSEIQQPSEMLPAKFVQSFVVLLG